MRSNESETLLLFPLEVEEQLRRPKLSLQGGVLAVSVCYSLLFLLGLGGNISVISGVRKFHRLGSLTINTTIIYLLALCLADLISTFSTPAIVLDQLYGVWQLGEVGCKANMLFESVSKALNSLLLTAIAFDRCAATAWPRRRRLRSNWTARTLVLLCVSVSLALASPVVLYSRLVPLPVGRPTLLLSPIPSLPQLRPNDTSSLIRLQRNENRTPAEGDANKRLALVQQVAARCNFELPPKLHVPYSLVCFATAFLLPTMGTVLFYGLMVRALRRRRAASRANRRSSAGVKPLPLRRIAATSLLTTAFYFLCLTPYWLLTTLLALVQAAADEQQVGGQLALVDQPPSLPHRLADKFVYFMLLVHWLPPLNASLNWIFYGLMNRELQRSYTRTRAPTVSIPPPAGGRTNRSKSQPQMMRPRRAVKKNRCLSAASQRHFEDFGETNFEASFQLLPSLQHVTEIAELPSS